MHPSMPEFADVCARRARISTIDLDPVLTALYVGGTERHPTDLLEVQLEAASEQLRVARERLVRSRRRVAELQEAVGQVQTFLDMARRCPVSA